GITGGYLPLSLVLSTDTIHAAFYDDDVARGFLHSHSYTGNPLACRAALATLDIFETDDVLARNHARAAGLDAALAPLQAHRAVHHLRRTGMIWAFDVAADPGFGQRYATAALARGLLLRPIGNTVYLMPPYVLDDDTAAWMARETLATLDDALKDR
ncbi:MAG TPA: aminotransferase class III-fold pyridoxal phosphate-dependent enzyme, partial [Bordetella sp.]|nr:aminotransferase class III-fold pyridoxal phosphate-dependent enzyme [Bordetella sp.]